MLEIFITDYKLIVRVGIATPPPVMTAVKLKVPATAVDAMFKGQVFVSHVPTVSQLGAPVKVADKV